MHFFKFQDGDWIKIPAVPQHHVRITDLIETDDGDGWYETFDSTPRRGRAGYEFVRAAELEATAVLVKRAESPLHVQQILARCRQLNGLPYAIPERQDCESIQAYIHTGREEDRWSGQVVGTLAAALILGLWWFGNDR